MRTCTVSLSNVYKQKTASRYYHNWAGLSVWTNQSTALKIIHKGGPISSVISHPLWETTSMERGQVTACFTERSWEEGSAEQRMGRHAKEGRKHTADQAHSLCPVHMTTETTYTCSHAEKNINTIHINIHIPSLAVVKRLSVDMKKCLAWLAHSGHAQSGQKVRSQSSVTSKLTHLLKRAEEVWPVVSGQRELAILAWIQAEERNTFLSVD